MQCHHETRPANIASSTDSLLLNGMTRVGGACALSSRLTQSVRSKFLLVMHGCRLMEGIYEAHMALMHVTTDQRSSSILPHAPAFKSFGARSSQQSNLGPYTQAVPDVSRTRFIADHLQDLLLVYCITTAIYSLANIVSFLTTCTMQSYCDSPTIEYHSAKIWLTKLFLHTLKVFFLRSHSRFFFKRSIASTTPRRPECA
jgi:hypothetical protein